MDRVRVQIKYPRVTPDNPYLQLQDSWEVISGSYRMPTQPAQGTSASDVTAFREAFVVKRSAFGCPCNFAKLLYLR